MTTEARTELIEGSHGQAWPIEFAKTEPAHAASLGQWIADVPWCHPVWPQHCFALVHLRPIEGKPPAFRQFALASHEIAVLAIVPDRRLHPGERSEKVPYMLPPDQVCHFIADSDAEAMARVEAALRAVIDGKLSCDSDCRTAFTNFMRQPLSAGTDRQ